MKMLMVDHEDVDGHIVEQEDVDGRALGHGLYLKSIKRRSRYVDG